MKPAIYTQYLSIVLYFCPEKYSATLPLSSVSDRAALPVLHGIPDSVPILRLAGSAASLH